MKKHTVLFAALMAFASLGFAATASANIAEESSVAARADAQVEKISNDLAKYIAEIDRAISMAKEGQYGKLQRGSEARLAEARQVIGNLLRDVASPRDLKPDQRIALFNAHQTIESVINKQDKDRVVCTRERKTGSRLSTAECLTVAEREERARAAAQSTASFQNAVCTPGEGNSCSL